MADKPLHPEFLKGFNQALDSIQVTLKSGKQVTQQDIDIERKHWNAMPVEALSPTELSKMEIASKTAQVRELNKALKESEELVKSVDTGINNLPGSFAKLGSSLSVLKP